MQPKFLRIIALTLLMIGVVVLGLGAPSAFAGWLAPNCFLDCSCIVVGCGGPLAGFCSGCWCFGLYCG